MDNQLKKYEFNDTESMLTEWNYADTWDYEDYKKIKSCFGASMTMASIIELQKSPADGGMYYDAEIRRDRWCGLFDKNTHETLKPYYALYYFGKLTDFGTETESISSNEDVFVASAVKDNSACVVLTNFSAKELPEKICFDREVQIKEILVTNEDVTNVYKSKFFLAPDGKCLLMNLKPYEMVSVELFV